ncbi:MAG: glycosyltransferase family 2 protein [Candidatus Xenobia bacterium]
MESSLEHGLTIFIPLYNEAPILRKNVQTVLEHLTRLCVPFEILLGSNGSTDGTVEVGHQLAQEETRITFFHLPHRGPGRAFAEAVRRAHFDSLVTLDADLSFDMHFVDAAWQGLAEHEAVVGSKHARQFRPWYRILASECFIKVTNYLLGMTWHDYAIGAKAYRTASIRPFIHRIDQHTFYTQRMLFQLMRVGKSIVEIPVHCEDNRVSRFNLLHEGFYRYGMLFLLWMESLVRQR